MYPKEAWARGRAPWAEILRILILVVTALAVMSPYFTSHLVGGVDARWYAYMLGDYIDQVRHGQFLVTVGQGPLAWNGSVHLYRSAPVYMAVARVWDLLSLRRLNPFALEHLTAITSAVVGGLGFYAAAVRILSNRRWTAMGMALLYLMTPSWLSAVIHAEAYMTYMAFGAMPLLLYGNYRTALHDDGKGYVILGAGLALIWMCHPPVAFISTLTTVFIQCSLIAGRGVLSWKEMAKGAAAFAILGAYYFVSMSELPPTGGTLGMRSEVMLLVGIALFYAGLGRSLISSRPFAWPFVAAAGAFLVLKGDPIWFRWAVSTAAVWAACAVPLRWRAPAFFGRHAFVVLFLSAVAGAAIAEAWVGRGGIDTVAITRLASNTTHFRDWLTPLKAQGEEYPIFQPGWALIALFAVCVLSAFGSRPLGAKVLFAAAFGLVIFFFRLPLASNFLVGRFPGNFSAMCGVPLDLRIAPVIASFVALGGVVWISTSKGNGAGYTWVEGSVLGALVLWSGFETLPLVEHNRIAVSTDFLTDRNLRPENEILDAYAYLLLPFPSYFSHGKTDPMIESRLLDRSGRVLVGPMQDAAVMEARGFRRVPLSSTAMPNSTVWFDLCPRITVEPNEHKLVRFEFGRGRSFKGYLVLSAEHSYRDYHLPDSGLEHGFGAGADMPSVLSLWNSGSTPEHYRLMLATEPGCDLGPVGSECGNLYISDLDVSKLPISVESLLPYRAKVSSSTGGTLETIRVFIPGYAASVDGKAVEPSASKNHLVSFYVPPGVHEVEVRFVGTSKLWACAWISGLGWLGLVGACGVKVLGARRAASS